ncbi:MAG: MATE family efflux transporter [Pseudomonadota bacterium]
MTDAASSPDRLTHGRVLRIAGPILLSNATVPILGAVDTGVVGQMGDPIPIGAVGIGAVILSTIYWMFGFLRMGTTGLTAQARGAGDAAEAKALLMRAILIGLAGGLFLILIQWPLFIGAFNVSPASAEVEALARDYMSRRLWSAPAAVALFGITGWLIALERTRVVLILQVWMNGLNIVLDLWFVLGLGWGVAGVATATLIAEWTGLALGLWFCRDALGNGAWRAWSRILDRARLLRMASVNGDILVRTALLEVILVSFLFLGGRVGDVTLAANPILLQFVNITVYTLDGFAFSAEALVGQAVGARSRAALRRAVRLCAIWGLATGCALSLVFLATGGMVVDMMTTSEEVRATAREYLVYMVLVPLVGAPAWLLDGYFIGATRTRDMRNMMVVTTIGYGILAMLLIPPFANHGLWIANLLSYVLRMVTLGSRYPALERSAAA